MEDNVLSWREKKVEGEKESDRETEIETHRNSERDRDTERKTKEGEKHRGGKVEQEFPLARYDRY